MTTSPTQPSAPVGPTPPVGPGRPAAAAALPGRRGPAATIAIVISLLALVVSAATALLALRALDRASDAQQTATAAGGQEGAGGPQPTAGPPGDSAGTQPSAAPTSAADGPASTVPPTLGQGTVYQPKYTNETLTLSMPTSCRSMYVDLHEPRANAAADISELSLYNCGGAPSFRITDGVTASMAGTPAMEPAECSDKIRTVPLGNEQKIPVRQAIVLCVITSFADSKSRGEDWRLVRVEISGVGNDTVTLKADSWIIPG
ncbi:hypothetical protein GCM10009681_24830 [Luedemannella helvata]|uniref:Uncharacterized protein n=2 Tax=Luedemannella helvata TaxID=349315 RepID=A0ABP4WET8_9ACTN